MQQLVKALPSDLTWDVPPELEEDYGLSLADRDRLLLHQQQERERESSGAATGTPDSPSPARNIGEVYRCGL
jgi:hypothetical protein